MARDLFQQNLEKLKEGFQNGLNTLQNNTLFSSQPLMTLDLQPDIKSGWLKKFGGIITTGWQRKWFVLKGDYLLFYSSPNQSKPPQGAIYLPGNNVNAFPWKPGEIEKFVFDIISNDEEGDGKVDMVRLAANSEGERKDWVRTLKKILFGALGGAIFENNLTEVMEREKMKNPRRKIPEVVEACVDHILCYGLQEEGIFRLPGAHMTVMKYFDLYERGFRPDLSKDENLDVHSVASLLKLYLSSLPSPLIPEEFYDHVIKLFSNEDEMNEERIDELKDEIMKIPNDHLNLLQYLCNFLSEVSNHSHSNKMTLSNLSIIFNSSFLRPSQNTDPILLMNSCEERKKITHFLISNQSKLFNFDSTPRGRDVFVENLINLDSFKEEDKQKIYTETSNESNDLLTFEPDEDLSSVIIREVAQRKNRNFTKLNEELFKTFVNSRVENKSEIILYKIKEKIFPDFSSFLSNLKSEDLQALSKSNLIQIIQIILSEFDLSS